MRRIGLAASALALCFCLSMVGCGSDNSVSDIQESPEAKAANNNGMGGMADFMKTKGQAKKK